MALLLPAALAAVGVYAVANTYDQKISTLNAAIARQNREAPIQGRYSNAASVSNLDRGIPHRVIEKTDLRGSRYYHVDFGNGSLTKMYKVPNWEVEY